MIKKIVAIISVPAVSWSLTIYWMLTGKIHIARGGGCPIYFSDEPFLFLFICFLVFGMGCIAAVVQYKKMFKINKSCGSQKSYRE